MQHIETIELTSSQANIVISSIPQDYDDLLIVLALRGNNGGVVNQLYTTLNSTLNVYSREQVIGNGSIVYAQGATDEQRLIIAQNNGPSSTSNTFGNVSLYFLNYTGSTSKVINTDSTNEHNATEGYNVIQSSLANITSGITDIEFDEGSGDFVAGSTISLYGITAGGDGTVSTA